MHAYVYLDNNLAVMLVSLVVYLIAASYFLYLDIFVSWLVSTDIKLAFCH